MPHPPRLISELVTLTRAWGWTLADCAREIGVSDVTLTQYRSGRRPLSMRVFARIAQRFGDQRVLRDLAWHYAAVEYHDADAPAPEVAVAALLAGTTVRTLGGYVENFAAATFDGGRGLYLTSRDAETLGLALTYLEARFRAAGVSVCTLRANRPPHASFTRFALAAGVLLVDRVDWIIAPVATLVSRRADLLRPTVVTSMAGTDAVADPRLRQIFTSASRSIEVAPAPEAASANPVAHAA